MQKATERNLNSQKKKKSHNLGWNFIMNKEFPETNYRHGRFGANVYKSTNILQFTYKLILLSLTYSNYSLHITSSNTEKKHNYPTT